MDEEADDHNIDYYQGFIYYPDSIGICKCLRDDSPTEKVEQISERKRLILTIVVRTENYLRERRIAELMRFLLTKVLADSPENPAAYFEKLLNDCMLFRAGHGHAPVLYEQRHIEAVVKSFDPGQRGWLSSGQVRRAYLTMGLTCEEHLDERVSTEAVVGMLKKSQETELYNLISVGVSVEEASEKTDDSTLKSFL